MVAGGLRESWSESWSGLILSMWIFFCWMLYRMRRALYSFGEGMRASCMASRGSFREWAKCRSHGSACFSRR